jgi:hypothetical protein
MYIFIGAAIANNDCVNNITHNKINQNRNANAQFMFIWVNPLNLMICVGTS